MHEAKSQLSHLVERVAAGEEVVIAKAGRPVARLVPVQQHTQPRQLGAFAGQIQIRDDFDELPEDIRAAFEGPRS